MSKLNAVQTAVVNAISAYKNGSTGVVRAFEQTMLDFWGEGRCQPHNVEFMVNALERFPILQKAAIKLLKQKGADALGYFTFKLVDVKTPSGKVKRVYEIKNQADITKEMKLVARQNIKAFVANEYTSLLHEKGVKAKLEKAFDASKAEQAMMRTITAQLKAYMLEHDGIDLDLLRGMADNAIKAAFAKENIAKVNASVAAEKAKVAA